MINGEQSRLEANKYLEYRLSKVQKPAQRRQLCRDIYDRYNIPIEITMDAVMFKRDISEFTNFEVFALISMLNPTELKKYFTEPEIEFMSEQKYEETGTKNFPLVFENIVQVNDSQWIGSISAKRLMEFRDAQLINYEEDSQRTLRHVMTGGIETLRININRKNVGQITDLFRKNLYISDDITLNMPLEGSTWRYDSKRHILYVDKLPNDQFNILDGYHRYIAMSGLYNQDSNFDYQMELRITNFSQEKAQQFIYQKDQKTHMSKTSSDSYNQYSPQNRIVTMLNQDPTFLMYGQINRSGDKIDFATMALFIKALMLPKGIPAEEENSIVLAIKAKLLTRINEMVSQIPGLATTKWQMGQLFSVIYVCSRDDIPPADYGKLLPYLFEKLGNRHADFINTSQIRRKQVNTTTELVKRWYDVQ